MQVNGYNSYSAMTLTSHFGVAARRAEADNSVASRFSNSADSGSSGIQGFAEDIISRIGTTAPVADLTSEMATATATATESLATSTETKDTSALEASLSRTAAFISSAYGDQAASTFMSVVAKNMGSGEVTEEGMAKGVMAGLQFIDKNYGVAAGDALIDNLNADLNVSMNEYFDNGLNERFYAVGGASGGSLTQMAASFADSVMAAYGEEASNTVLDILQQGIEAGGARGFERGLEEARGYLADTFGDTQALAAADMNGMADTASAKAGFVGVTLDLAV
ncbi:MAG: hypothetical protein AB7E47_04850 [Desulfovibrionaceae bacterium]